LFKPVVDELQTLYEEGFRWYSNGKLVVTKAILCLFCCDSVARPSLLNIKRFNGEYGCGFCEHPGVVVSKGQAAVRVYTEASCVKAISSSYEVSGAVHITVRSCLSGCVCLFL